MYKVEKEIIEFRIRLINSLCKLLHIVENQKLDFGHPIEVIRIVQNQSPIKVEKCEVVSINGDFSNDIASIVIVAKNFNNEKLLIVYNKSVMELVDSSSHETIISWSAESLSCESLMLLIKEAMSEIILKDIIKSDVRKKWIEKELDEYLGI